MPDHRRARPHDPALGQPLQALPQPPQWWEKHGRKPAPNPGGKRGNAAHEATVDKLFERAGKDFPGDRIVREQSIQGLKTPGGKTIRIAREPDVTVIDAKDGSVKQVYEAARAKKDGTLVTREAAKQRQYNALGIKNHFEIVREK